MAYSIPLHTAEKKNFVVTVTIFQMRVLESVKIIPNQNNLTSVWKEESKKKFCRGLRERLPDDFFEAEEERGLGFYFSFWFPVSS